MIPWQTLETVGQLLNDGELDEIEIENDDLRIRLRGEPEATVTAAAPMQAGEAGTGAAPSGGDGAAGVEESSEDLVVIEAPMVGTYYGAPAPDADPFVDVGDHVSYSTTVCIIEAMKLMNEIEAECEGTIRKVCQNNADPVSKGDPLFYVEPD